VHVLQADPELGLRVPASRIGQARAELMAPFRSLGCGVWDVPTLPSERGCLGFLLLDGLLASDTVLAGNVSTELFGEGDVLQPLAGVRDDRLLRCRVQWHVLDPVHIAILDDRFARRLIEWPQVSVALLERSMRQSRRLSIHQALLGLSPVETRLLVLFWHLAERWGRVTPAGVMLTLKISHQLLGQLVGCTRTSVTTALKEVARSDRALRRQDGSWLLRGAPPDELSRPHWNHHGAAKLPEIAPRRQGSSRRDRPAAHVRALEASE
jgi:CRP/FNR family cyclic AMP-dependent transcriptional regulator